MNQQKSEHRRPEAASANGTGPSLALNLTLDGALHPHRLPADRLGQLVSEVRADAQVAPGAYLNDAIVPEGGE